MGPPGLLEDVILLEFRIRKLSFVRTHSGRREGRIEVVFGKVGRGGVFGSGFVRREREWDFGVVFVRMGRGKGLRGGVGWYDVRCSGRCC